MKTVFRYGTLSMLTGQSTAAEVAQQIYDDINGRAANHVDFELSQLELSRQYFDLSTPELRTRRFDVLTTLAGLPIPADLQDALTRQLDAILNLFPDDTRVYRVRPQLLHWESHIIRRPGEPAPPVPVENVSRQVCRRSVRGLGLCDRIPRVLRCSRRHHRVPGLRSNRRRTRGAAKGAVFLLVPTESDWPHLGGTGARPVGKDAFQQLLELRDACDTQSFGELPVRQIKLVSERRWYMEDHEIVREVSLRG